MADGLTTSKVLNPIKFSLLLVGELLTINIVIGGASILMLSITGLAVTYTLLPALLLIAAFRAYQSIQLFRKSNRFIVDRDTIEQIVKFFEKRNVKLSPEDSDGIIDDVWS